MSILLGKPDCVHADQSLQPSSVFSIILYYVYCILCVVTVDLGVLSSADRWVQLWTRMDVYVCMYALVKDLMSCYSWLWNVCLWNHRLNITERLTTGYYECMHGEKEWYLENVQALFVSFPDLCTMNALHTCMPSLSASFCSRRYACIVFIGSSWRWDFWVYQNTLVDVPK